MKNLLFVLLVMLSACAKIPVESVELMSALETEGQRMHTMNKLLLNRMFAQKKAAIDSFIRHEYTPTFVSNIVERIPTTTIETSEVANLLSKAMPVISKRRDAMHAALEDQRLKLIEKLDADYLAFQKAAVHLQALLSSAVKIDAEKQKAFDYLHEVSGKRIDFNRIEKKLDEYLIKAGAIGADIDKGGKQLEEAIDNLLKE